MKTVILKPSDENIALCAEAINGGKTVAFPTETVYGLGASAYDPKAISEIFRVKGRPNDNPLIVHVASADAINGLVREVTSLAEKLIARFMPGPVTLVLKKSKSVPDQVTAGLDTVGVRMPSHPVCVKFLRACNVPVAAPSANTSTRPSPTCAKHVLGDLAGRIPYILNGGHCEVGLESTIVDVSGAVPKLLRAGGISRDEIAEACGCEVEIAASGKVALCPGMKYKHYSPKAEVYFSAYYSGMAAGIAMQYDALTSAGKNPVILCTEKNAGYYGTRNVYDMGADYRDYAHNLFYMLRKADSDNFDSVIAEGVPSDGIGAAIINRLVKSSGGKII